MVCVEGESMYMETRGQLWGISSLRLLWVPGTELGCKNCLGKRSAGWAILLTLNLNSSRMNVYMYSSSHKCVAHWIFKNEIDRHQGQGELRLSVAFFPSLPLPKVSAMLTCTDGHAFVTDTNRISHTACKLFCAASFHLEDAASPSPVNTVCYPCYGVSHGTNVAHFFILLLLDTCYCKWCCCKILALLRAAEDQTRTSHRLLPHCTPEL